MTTYGTLYSGRPERMSETEKEFLKAVAADPYAALFPRFNLISTEVRWVDEQILFTRPILDKEPK